MPRPSNIIVNYEVKVIAKVPGFLSEEGILTCKLPILICGETPVELKNIVAPKELGENYPNVNTLVREHLDEVKYPNCFWQMSKLKPGFFPPETY